ncbi:hypothetical protein [Gandjariella thermophila]|uniref:Anti-sigma-M factor RsmA n=1 Tax=Gandjariella thermophila TaxID=1931992 RepID=A0A4D4J6Z6_9PSEU|nr:hypothetical protein [Gandjariella thermophila]GDY30922.1 hypothetical protein GTS_25550 [Gandjariella thermophila]
MTGDERRSGAPMGPPWSVDLLADLHAGALDEATEANLRPRVAADPEATAVLDALERTRTQLASLPRLTMPDDVAARIESALAAEARQAAISAPPRGAAASESAAPVTDLGAARRRRNRRMGWATGLLATAAAAGVVLLTIPRGPAPSTAPPPQAGGAPTGGASTSGPLALRSGDLGASVSQVIGVTDYGPLRDQQRLAGCLTASNVAAAGRPLGVRPVVLDGQPRVLAILPAGRLGAYRLLVIDPSCGPGHPGVLSDTTIGAR